MADLWNRGDRDDFDDLPNKEKCAQGDNTAKNKEAKAAFEKLGIKDPGQQRRLHDEITGRGLKDYQDILRYLQELGY